MIEPEMAFADLSAITDLAESLIKYVINHVLDNHRVELEYLEGHGENQKEIINKLRKVANQQFKKVNYAQALEILKEKKEVFVFNKIK